MPTVAEIMTSSVITVHPDSTLSEVLTDLATQHISGAAVVDHKGRLVGVVTHSDIMEAESEISDPELRGRYLEETPVREIMSAPVLTIEPEAAVREAALQMEYGEVHRLFVEANGQLVGVVSRSDVNRALATGKV
jgi:CBS domain-containing protein